MFPADSCGSIMRTSHRCFLYTVNNGFEDTGSNTEILCAASTRNTTAVTADILAVLAPSAHRAPKTRRVLAVPAASKPRNTRKHREYPEHRTPRYCGHLEYERYRSLKYCQYSQYLQFSPSKFPSFIYSLPITGSIREGSQGVPSSTTGSASIL